MKKLTKRKVLITGSEGQLGSDLMSILTDRYLLSGIDINNLDITDLDAVREYVNTIKPDIILHAAAFTNVDQCETDKETAHTVNVKATENLARCASENSARLIYYSTDYVFSGEAREKPYIESDLPAPKTVYGQTKLGGETAIQNISDSHAILRIAWVYGLHGNNFVKTMIKLGKAQISAGQKGEKTEPLKVVDDQIGNPTWTEEIARQTITVIENDLTGIFHATAQDSCSWYQFAQAIFESIDLDVNLIPCVTSEYPRPAPRPAFSVLANDRLEKIGLNVMRPYRTALVEFVEKNRASLLK